MAQYVLSKVLNLPANKINVKVKRIGGSYGGKITRCNQVRGTLWLALRVGDIHCKPIRQPLSLAAQIAALAAMATQITGRAVQLQLDLQTNMQMVGKRHPFVYDYKVGYEDDGRVHTLNGTVCRTRWAELVGSRLSGRMCRAGLPCDLLCRLLTCALPRCSSIAAPDSPSRARTTPRSRCS